MAIEGQTKSPRKTFLAAVGDANDPITWSGIPYYFLQTAAKRGLIQAGLPLRTDLNSWKIRRWAWNAFRPLTFDRFGGYQYSISFLERLWRPVRDDIRGGAVVNCFQLFPPSIMSDASIEKWFFIDQTLRQLFDVYGDRTRIGARIAEDAIERERSGYEAARGVIVHSQWAAQSVRTAYGVDENKIHVVVPGANLDPAAYAEWEAHRQHGASLDSARPIRLVCVGKHFQRKGIDRLLRSFALARGRGFNGTLRIIGCPIETVPEEFRSIAGGEWMGFVNKRREANRFLSLVTECDLGCLLSRAEAGGIAFREYHALGLPVIGTDAGGAPEHMLPGASMPVPTSATDDEIAMQLLALDADRDRLRSMQAVAGAQRHSCLWDATVSEILKFWPYEPAMAHAEADRHNSPATSGD